MRARSLGHVSGALLVTREDVPHRRAAGHRVVQREDRASGRPNITSTPSASSERRMASAPFIFM